MELRSTIESCQYEYDQRVSQLRRRSQVAWHVNVLLNSLSLSGFLRSARNLRDAVVSAISVCIPERSLQEHLLSRLQAAGNETPSSTVLYRHRLMFVMGCAKRLAQLTSAILSAGP
eukprot:12832140-Alexandrium_andersonii.AAC.1